MQEMIEAFFEEVASGNIEIYNEFSLQHELGIFLRGKFQDKRVQFERNVSYFGFDKSQLEKKEMDIVLFSNREILDVAIEVKYPRNGQVPESFFSFCKDIVFLEQLKRNRVSKAYFLAVVEDKTFYEGNEVGIYKYFRGETPVTLSCEITKPTGSKDKVLTLKGSYNVKWNTVKTGMKYCLIEIV